MHGRLDQTFFVEFWEQGRNVAAGDPPKPAKFLKLTMRKKSLGTSVL